jgi:hypothetical protein
LSSGPNKEVGTGLRKIIPGRIGLALTLVSVEGRKKKAGDLIGGHSDGKDILELAIVRYYASLIPSPYFTTTTRSYNRQCPTTTIISLSSSSSVILE